MQRQSKVLTQTVDETGLAVVNTQVLSVTLYVIAKFGVDLAITAKLDTRSGEAYNVSRCFKAVVVSCS